MLPYAVSSSSSWLWLQALLVALVPLVGGGASYGTGTAVGPYLGGAGGCVGAGCGPDFNPALLGGSRGFPGLRARINQKAFQYASGIVAELINTQIKKARLPDISQPIGVVEGCVQVYNLYVSRFRCPQRVLLFPKPPNRLVIQIQGMDLGVTGNLGGQAIILVPIPLYGIVNVNVWGINLAVEAEIMPGPNGPRVKICSCALTTSYVDVCIENGGFVGSVVNSLFRRSVSERVQSQLPSQVCEMLPKEVDKMLNSRMGAIPQAIALTQILQLAGGALGFGGPQPSPAFCAQCQGKSAPSAASPVAPQIPDQPAAPQPAPQLPASAYTDGANKTVRSVDSFPPTSQALNRPVYHTRQISNVGRDVPRFQPRPVMQHAVLQSLSSRKTLRIRRAAISRSVIVRGNTHHRVHARVVRGSKTASALVAPPPQSPIASGLCSQCPAGDDPTSFLRDLAAGFDLTKLNDLFLSVQLMNVYATCNDFTIDLVGEFSPGGMGGTPFGPFPVMFPAPADNHMAEAIVTDFTINSLLYHMHRKGFMVFRIGPETPRIGELLKTTCSEDDEEELEDHGVEIDEAEESKKRSKRRHLRHLLQLRQKRSVDAGRSKRQTDDAAGGGDLSDLGICFGDILPAIREKYPNKKISIQVRTTRAPSIILTRAKGGAAILNIHADADIYIDGTNTRVGTISIETEVIVAIQIRGNRIFGMVEITQLNLKDHSGSLGLPQDALDNLGTLGKELISKLANDALMKGIPLNVMQTGAIPITFYNTNVVIVEHGLYLAGDLSISPSLLGMLTNNGGAGCYRL